MHSRSIAITVAVVLSALVALPLGGMAQDAASPGASTAVTPRPPGEWFFALEPGMCFDDAWDADGNFDFATLPLIVPCDVPHDNEVVAIVPMGDGDFPSGDLKPLAVELCEPEDEAFLGRSASDALMGTSAYWPIETGWDAGARSAICTVYTGHTLWLMRADGSEQSELTGVDAIGWARFADDAVGGRVGPSGGGRVPAGGDGRRGEQRLEHDAGLSLRSLSLPRLSGPRQLRSACSKTAANASRPRRSLGSSHAWTWLMPASA